jgi:hypothetical protein
MYDDWTTVDDLVGDLRKPIFLLTKHRNNPLPGSRKMVTKAREDIEAVVRQWVADYPKPADCP